YALIGLGAEGGRFAEEAEAAIVTFARHPAPLAASLWTLGRVGEARHVTVLREHLRRTAPVPASAAAIALGRFVQRGIAVDEARAALTEALFAADESVRAAAGRALRDEWRDDVLPDRPDANVERTVTTLLAQSGGHGAGTDAGLAPALRESGRAALRGPIERVSAVLARVDENGRLDVGSFSPELFAEVVPAWADDIAALNDHPNAEVRERVARILGTLSGDTVEAALAILLQDSEASVIRAALRSVSQVRSVGASERVAELLQSEDWSVRLEAARTLGALNQPEALIAALETDAYAYVREAAARALAGHQEAQEALQRAQSSDSEPIVRAAATAALSTE
ncbi:MAG: HEAT repeat protein, partial [Polyangiales bacterium]